MKILVAKSRVSKQVRAAVQNVVDDVHEKYKNSYFWSSNGSASGRRSSEKRFEDLLPAISGVRTEKGLITWEMSYRESCHHWYYSGAFYLDGEKKT